MRRRVLSVLTVLAMCLSWLPGTARATEGEAVGTLCGEPLIYGYYYTVSDGAVNGSENMPADGAYLCFKQGSGYDELEVHGEVSLTGSGSVPVINTASSNSILLIQGEAGASLEITPGESQAAIPYISKLLLTGAVNVSMGGTGNTIERLEHTGTYSGNLTICADITTGVELESAGSVAITTSNAASTGFSVTSGGSVTVNAIDGASTIFNESAGVEINAAGPVSITNSNGSLFSNTTASHSKKLSITGKSVSLVSDDGENPTIPLRAPNVSLKATDGDITVENLTGKSRDENVTVDAVVPDGKNVSYKGPKDPTGGETDGSISVETDSRFIITAEHTDKDFKLKNKTIVLAAEASEPIKIGQILGNGSDSTTHVTSLTFDRGKLEIAGINIAGEDSKIVLNNGTQVVVNDYISTGSGAGNGSAISIGGENASLTINCSEAYSTQSLTNLSIAAGGQMTINNGGLDLYYNSTNVGDKFGVSLGSGATLTIGGTGTDAAITVSGHEDEDDRRHALNTILRFLPQGFVYEFKQYPEGSGNYALYDDNGLVTSVKLIDPQGERQPFNVTKKVHPEAAGTVTIVPASADSKYSAGTQVTLTAAPGENYKFSQWLGLSTNTNTSTGISTDTVNSDNSLTIKVTKNREITAEFTPKDPPIVNISLTADPSSLSGGGTVKLTVTSDSVLDAGELTLTCPNASATRTSDNTWTATLPNKTANYEFTAKYTEDDDHMPATASCTVSVTGTYTPPPPPTYCTIRTEASPTEGGTITGGRSYVAWSTATLTAEPAEGYTFSHWEENGARLDADNPYRFSVVRSRTITACFEKASYTVTVEVGAGGTASGGGTYPAGETATVSASANEGWLFTGWKLAGVDTIVSTEPSYTFEVTGDTALTACFEEIPPIYYTVTVNADEGGSASGGGTYQEGETVTVTAAANEGWKFAGWWLEEESVSDAPEYTFEVTDHVTLTARFEKVYYTVTVEAGEGGSASGGGTYPEGETVTVTAAANEGWKFAGWWLEEASVSDAPEYTFEVTDHITLTARFEKVYHTVTVEADEGGSATGGGTYQEGEAVTVTAAANEGWLFAGWWLEEESVSDAPEYTFNVTGDITLTARFEKAPVSYTVTVEADEGGSASGGGTYQEGETITVTAAANEGWLFAGWWLEEESVSDTPEYTFEVTGNVTLTARFEKALVSYTVTAEAGEGGSASGGGTYPEGETATLNAIPNEGWYFTHWDDGTEKITENPYEFTVAGDRTLTARFEAKAKPELAVIPSRGSLYGGGTVTLRVTGIPGTGETTLVCSDGTVELKAGTSKHTWTATLPNRTAEYTFTAAYPGDDTHMAAEASCTVRTTAWVPVSPIYPDHPGTSPESSTPNKPDAPSEPDKPEVPDDKECDGGPDCPSREYPDLEPEEWYHPDTDFVLEEDLMKGFEDGTFRPDEKISRAMLVQTLYNHAGRPAVREYAQFSDVSPDAWYAPAVSWAVQRGIVRGFEDGTFRPDAPIVREELAVILWRYAGSPAVDDAALPFEDAGKASEWALEALRWAVKRGILNGKGNGILDPQGFATRAEAAKMLRKFMEQ